VRDVSAAGTRRCRQAKTLDGVDCVESGLDFAPRNPNRNEVRQPSFLSAVKHAARTCAAWRTPTATILGARSRTGSHRQSCNRLNHRLLILAPPRSGLHLVMTAAPAVLAGSSRLAVCPTQRRMLAAAGTLGVTESAHRGARPSPHLLTHRSIPRVEKIFGPGNRFVTAANNSSAAIAPSISRRPTEAIVLAARAIHSGLPLICSLSRARSRRWQLLRHYVPRSARQYRQQLLRNCCIATNNPPRLNSTHRAILIAASLPRRLRFRQLLCSNI